VTLALLAERMPHLRSLEVSLDSTALLRPSDSSVILRLPFPLSLTELLVHWSDSDPSGSAPSDPVAAAEYFNALVLSLSSLAHLSKLTLRVPKWQPDWSLAPLQRLPCLRRLVLDHASYSRADVAEQMTDAQVAELRALTQLESVWINHMSLSLLSRLLAPPHQLRWQELRGLRQWTADAAALMQQLPLTNINVSRLAMPHMDFLLHMQQLTQLRLGPAANVPFQTARIFRTLASCTSLHSLTLLDDEFDTPFCFTSDDLTACLPKLPSLHTLLIHFAVGLTMLSFLAQGTLPATLTKLDLHVFRRRVPVAEMKHVLGLSALQSLFLTDVFDEPLGEGIVQQLTPSVAAAAGQQRVLAALTCFEHSWAPASTEP
jgi:hypothetical protein